MVRRARRARWGIAERLSERIDSKELPAAGPIRMARRPTDARSAAEAAFKAVTTKAAEAPPRAPSLPNVKEMVSLRIDRDVLDYFQQGGPGWQDRINAALRKVAGK